MHDDVHRRKVSTPATKAAPLGASIAVQLPKQKNLQTVAQQRVSICPIHRRLVELSSYGKINACLILSIAEMQPTVVGFCPNKNRIAYHRVLLLWPVGGWLAQTETIVFISLGI